MLSEESAFCILARLTDDKIEIFAAASEGNRFLVQAADAYGRGICARALRENGLNLDPYVLKKTAFVGINFLRFLGAYPYLNILFLLDSCIS